LRKYVFSKFMPSTQFLPPTLDWGLAAPCTNDTSYTHKVLQGQVSDGNSYAMGGIAGHAGLFSHAGDLANFAARIMFPAMFPTSQHIINQTTITLFTTEYNHTQSSRALGWDTNDPAVPGIDRLDIGKHYSTFNSDHHCYHSF
jgi:serine-type D-Ala-D-Ala carboxypeptidase